MSAIAVFICSAASGKARQVEPRHFQNLPVLARFRRVELRDLLLQVRLAAWRTIGRVLGTATRERQPGQRRHHDTCLHRSLSQCTNRSANTRSPPRQRTMLRQLLP
ncbi:hypothetical protein ACFSHP_16020 [Novosphingobium panipatense]